MNLLLYWQILKRRWLTMLIPTVMVLILTVATAEEAVIPPPVYTVGVRFLVAPPDIDENEIPNLIEDEENRYYQWLTSEYVVNGLADWVNSIRFAELVSEQAAAEGVAIDPLAIFGNISSDAIRSRLTMTVNYGDRDDLAVIMDQAIAAVVTQNGLGVPHLNGETAVVMLLDEPIINEIAPSITGQLDLPVRIVIALFIGVLVGVLMEYFDPYIRSSAELEEAGLDVWGEIV